MIRPEEHLGLAYAVAGPLLRGATDRDEVLGVALEELVRAARRFDPARGPWPAYAATCVRLAVRGAVARQLEEARRLEPLVRVDPESGEERDREDLPAVGPDAEARLLRRQLRDLLALLPATERAVLLGRARGESVARLADELGLSRGAVTRLERLALARLRREVPRAPRRGNLPGILAR